MTRSATAAKRPAKKKVSASAAAPAIGYPLNSEELLIPATRYYLGRCTIGAVCHARALAAQWPSLPANVRSILRREIEEEFERDDAARDRGDQVLPLGQDCDRDAWHLVRLAWLAADTSGKRSG